MKVYILERGENHEGGSILSIHATKESANETALKYYNEDFGWDDYTDEVTGEVWKHRKEFGYQEDGCFTASGGCDWIRVFEHEVVE